MILFFFALTACWKTLNPSFRRCFSQKKLTQPESMMCGKQCFPVLSGSRLCKRSWRNAPTGWRARVFQQSIKGSFKICQIIFCWQAEPFLDFCLCSCEDRGQKKAVCFGHIGWRSSTVLYRHARSAKHILCSTGMTKMRRSVLHCPPTSSKPTLLFLHLRHPCESRDLMG